jgi:hypothetical protein
VTPVELAQLRDKIARQRIAVAPPRGYHHSERVRAGEAALDALARAERRRWPRRRKCVYCGADTRSVKNPAVCAEHRDLPALDPAYNV